MKICLSICNNHAEDLQLSDHFGESGRFVIFDTHSGLILPHASNSAPCRGPCHCQLPSVGDYEFDAVICRGIGARSFALLRRKQVDVFITRARSMQDALNDWDAQKVQPAYRGTCRPEFLAKRRQSMHKSRKQ